MSGRPSCPAIKRRGRKFQEDGSQGHLRTLSLAEYFHLRSSFAGRSDMSIVCVMFLENYDRLCIYTDIRQNPRPASIEKRCSGIHPSACASSSISMACSERLPLSVVRPTAASAAFCVCTSSFRALTRRLWFLPFLWANKLCSPSNHFAHSMQYHSPNPGRSSAALVDLY
jgi:hypothetical protein